MKKPLLSIRQKGFFQLNPPDWVGEIICDDEIPCGDEIRCKQRMGGFNFICEADFIRALLGFHRALRDFIEEVMICNGKPLILHSKVMEFFL